MDTPTYKRHHVEYLLQTENPRAAFTTQSIVYKLGSPKEREHFINVQIEAKDIITTGQYTVDDSLPDSICNACIRPDCNNSGVFRSNRQVAQRLALLKTIENDEELITILQQPVTPRGLGLAIERIIDKHVPTVLPQETL
jgi:hypothetical protein